MRFGWLVALMVLVKLLVGCGDDDTDGHHASGTSTGGVSGGGTAGDTSRSDASVDEHMRAWIEAECAARDRCCSSIGEPIDYANCVANRSEWRDTVIGQGIVSGAIVLDFTPVGECLEGLGRMGCDDPPPEACWDVFVGTLRPGEACQFDVECAAPAGALVQCHQYTIDSSGCVQYTGAELGDPCRQTCVELPGGFTSCTDRGSGTGEESCWTTFGYYCGDTGTCVPLGQHGDSCAGNEQCAPGLRCVEEACADPIALGDPCTLVDYWQSPCEEGAYCADDGICRALGAAGEACDDTRACTSGWCSSTGRCAPYYLECI